MRAEKPRTWRSVSCLGLFLALAMGPSPVAADNGEHLVLKSVDAALYELSENACAVDVGSKCVIDPKQAIARAATSSLQGLARLGTILCPSAALVINPKSDSCIVTALGTDYVSFVDGQGTLSGTVATVVQLDNPVDSPEFPVVTGTFSGAIDFSPAFSGIPLGYVTGSVTITASPLAPGLVGATVPFTGVFRQPFAMGSKGEKKFARRSEAAFYLVDGKPVPVKPDERAVGWPTVRFEVTFTPTK